MCGKVHSRMLKHGTSGGDVQTTARAPLGLCPPTPCICSPRKAPPTPGPCPDLRGLRRSLPPDGLADLLVLQDLAPQKNFPGGLPLSFAQETCPPERSFAVSMAGEWPRALPPVPAGKEGGWRSSKGFTGQAQRGPVTHLPSVEATLVPEQRRVGSGWGAGDSGRARYPLLGGAPLWHLS